MKIALLYPSWTGASLGRLLEVYALRFSRYESRGADLARPDRFAERGLRDHILRPVALEAGVEEARGFGVLFADVPRVEAVEEKAAQEFLAVTTVPHAPRSSLIARPT